MNSRTNTDAPMFKVRERRPAFVVEGCRVISESTVGIAVISNYAVEYMREHFEPIEDEL
jgi:hypothetical protein